MKLFGYLPSPDSSNPRRYDERMMSDPAIQTLRFPMGGNFRTDIAQNMRDATYYANPGRNQSDFDQFEPIIGQNNNFDIKRAASVLTNINVNCKSVGDKKSLLHIAAERGNEPAISFLVCAGVCVEALDAEKQTPIMKAVEQGNPDAVKTLIKVGANLAARDQYSITVGEHAKIAGHKEYEPLLKATKNYLHEEYQRYGVHYSNNVEAFFAKERPMGTKEYRKKKEQILEMLKYNKYEEKEFGNLVACFDINKSHFTDGSTLLHLAARTGNLKAVQHLLRLGAEVDAVSRDKSTPLMVAALYGHENVVRTLLKNGANVCARDMYGGSAVEAAREYENIDKLLSSLQREIEMLFVGVL